MTVDFSKLGKTTMGELKPPPVSPEGSYVGVIRSWKWAESRWKNKETGQTEAQVHFTIKPTGFADGERDKVVDDSLREGIKFDGVITAEQGIQSDAQVYYMQEFLRGLGVNVTGRNLDECLPDAIGAQVKYDLVVKDGERGPIANVRRLRTAD
jgi:hypothetical protein